MKTIKKIITSAFCLIPYCLYLYTFPLPCFAQGAWVQKAYVGGGPRFGTLGFSIPSAGKGYIGTGIKASGNLSYDFWEYDPLINQWTQKADVPNMFGGYDGAVGFSILNKGYIGTGWDNMNTHSKGFYQYDPATNTWTTKNDFGGLERRDAVGFSIGSKGYLGLGWNANFDDAIDFWEYDPVTDAWTQKADHPFPYGATNGACFTIDCKGYVFRGDLWEYDPAANLWTQKSTWPGNAFSNSVGFSIGMRGYIGTGNGTNGMSTEFWQYNPVTDTWLQKADFAGLGRHEGAGFSLAGKGYIGCGWNGGILAYNDFWEYTPDSVFGGITPTAIVITGPDTLCSGSAITLTASGGTTYIWNTGNTTSAITVTPSNDTVYTVVGFNYSCSGADSIAITVIPNPSVTITGDTVICKNAFTTLAATGPGAYLWNTGSTASSLTVNPSASSMYSVIVSNGLCTAGDSITVIVNNNPSVNAGNDVTITIGESTTLIATGGGAYSWSPSTGLSCTTCANPVAAPPATGGTGGLTYCVLVTDTNNCSASACVTVITKEVFCGALPLFIPNAFSPNNDGENDELKIYYADIRCIESIHLVIYDRWGEKVFETDNPSAEWDGARKGKPENTAVFVYYLKATLTSGEKFSKKGNITLIR